MAEKIFPLKETGDSVNSNFISVSIQLDSTKRDTDITKGWYADAHMIAILYKVKAYPTYLFFSSDGKLVHRAVGSTETAGQFVGYVNDALNPERQYYSMVGKYDNSNVDTVLLESLGRQALANGMFHWRIPY
jgi:hypothetical protein